MFIHFIIIQNDRSIDYCCFFSYFSCTSICWEIMLSNIWYFRLSHDKHKLSWNKNIFLIFLKYVKNIWTNFTFSIKVMFFFLRDLNHQKSVHWTSQKFVYLYNKKNVYKMLIHPFCFENMFPIRVQKYEEIFDTVPA